MEGFDVMDERTRTHCRLDLHKAQEGSDRILALAGWVNKWGKELDEFLLDSSPEIDEDAVESAEAEATKLEEELAVTRNAVEDFVKKFDDRVEEMGLTNAQTNELNDLIAVLEGAI